MANMSYCRFNNTSLDLRECQEVLEELLAGGDEPKLSEEELGRAKRLVETCRDIVALFAGICDAEVQAEELGDSDIALILDTANKGDDDK